ncbi:MAG: hypothetical protein NTZ33_04675 [Bacteroidetes bacterium]|nr:hypothetical protein [Bacteroidota bacterium]
MKGQIHYYICFSFILLLFTLKGNAQLQNDSLSDYKNKPLWINMIDNPEANYYEAIKAYETYFQYHKKPKMEEDSRAEANENNENETDDEYLKSLSPEELNNYGLMKYQVKRFENWINEMKPFVQENGHILTEEERAGIWQKQQKEIKRQQK